MNGQELVERIDNLLIKTNKKRTPMLLELELPRTAMINWYNNNNIPAGDILFKLANYFNVSMEYLLTGKEEGKEFNINLPEGDKILLEKYNKLSEENKKIVLSLIENLGK